MSQQKQMHRARRLQRHFWVSYDTSMLYCCGSSSAIRCLCSVLRWIMSRGFPPRWIGRASLRSGFKPYLTIPISWWQIIWQGAHFHDNIRGSRGEGKSSSRMHSSCSGSTDLFTRIEVPRQQIPSQPTRPPGRYHTCPKAVWKSSGRTQVRCRILIPANGMPECDQTSATLVAGVSCI